MGMSCRVMHPPKHQETSMRSEGLAQYFKTFQTISTQIKTFHHTEGQGLYIPRFLLLVGLYLSIIMADGSVFIVMMMMADESVFIMMADGASSS